MVESRSSRWTPQEMPSSSDGIGERPPRNHRRQLNRTVDLFHAARWFVGLTVRADAVVVSQ